MASLLDKSLDDIRSERSPKRRGGRGAGNRSLSSSQRSNPYSRPLEPQQDEDTWSHDLYEPTGKKRSRVDLDKDEPRISAKLSVENLHYEVSERELEALFSQVGELEKPPTIKFDKSGRSEGRAWVVFKQDRSATEAIRLFNGANAKGQPITVAYDYSYTRPTAPPALLGRLEGGKDLFDAPARGFGKSFGSKRGGVSRTYEEPKSSSRGRGSSARGRGGRGGSRSERGAPKTAEELDNELASFMSGGDVEMAN